MKNSKQNFIPESITQSRKYYFVGGEYNVG